MGHGTLQADVFRTTLRAEGVAVAADVRRFAGSRKHPQFGADEMRGWLGDAAIEYRPLPELGGRRTPRPDSPNMGLRNSGFRGYADYMATLDFRMGFNALLALASERTTAIFCAQDALRGSCHRRLVADDSPCSGRLRGGPLPHRYSRAARSPRPGCRARRRQISCIRYNRQCDGKSEPPGDQPGRPAPALHDTTTGPGSTRRRVSPAAFAASQARRSGRSPTGPRSRASSRSPSRRPTPTSGSRRSATPTCKRPAATRAGASSTATISAGAKCATKTSSIVCWPLREGRCRARR